MAKARVIVADQNSAEVDHLRRTVNTLLIMIESAEASITAGASAGDILDAWADAVRTGVDNNPAAIANVTSSGREILGLKGTPKHPDRARMAQTVSMVAADKY